MEFKISQEEFVKGLHRTQSVVEKKGTMPILLNVLIEAQESEIVITATDLEIGLKGRHPAEIIKIREDDAVGEKNIRGHQRASAKGSFFPPEGKSLGRN